jgi:ABC-2 type transport system ATP-binding protein
MNSEAGLQLTSLSKRYNTSSPYALKDVSLTVTKGQIYGFLGPNGAGKSTTIRMLLNFIQPTSGSATIFGHDIVKDTVLIRKSIGYLSGDFKAYDKMTGDQFLDYMADLQPPKAKKVRLELVRQFQVNTHKRIRDLSKGNRQKIGIIQAFMHEPDLLVLDEPTDGLDPLMQETFYELVKTRRSTGATVFVSSHNLAEVQKMCDRVGIIRDGKLVRETTIASLVTEAAQTFEVTFGTHVPMSKIKAVEGVKKITAQNNTSTIHVHGNLKPFLVFLSKQDIVALSTKSLNLEDEFMRYYESGAKE